MYKTLVTAENAISLPLDVSERLENNPPGLYLTKQVPVKDMFNQEQIDKLAKDYNVDRLLVEFVVLTWKK